MAATKAISRSPSINGTKTHGILVDTLQLVAPRKELPVPNHLVETKIFSKVAQNSVVKASPAVINFGGFEVGRTLKQTLWLANVSTEVQRYHIIPPQTKYFNIRYTKNERLVPGLTLDCVIEFSPDEWRYYYDCVRIHCKGEENLIIPIHAYPVMNTADFPGHVDFPPVPVGQTKRTSLPLRCNCPIDFEFQVLLPQPHPAFKVQPLSGVIPANGTVDIHVTFSPSDFSTCTLTLQVNVSQFNSKPLVCRIVGYSAPGLLKELTLKSPIQDPRVLDPTCISPIDRSRRKRTKKITESSSSKDVAPTEIERDGIKFPSDLQTPYAVASVLNQEPGKLRAKDLREAVLAKQGSTPSTRQMKEALFEYQVRQNVYEERQNQLRWQVKLGDDQISAQDKAKIFEERNQAWIDYKYKRGDPLEKEELVRTCTECSFRRNFRDSDEVGKQGVQFDLYTNDPWAVRHRALGRFAQAARKIIIRRRADEKIEYLKKMVEAMGKRKQSQHSPTKLLHEKDDEKDIEVDTYMTPDKIRSVTFPTYSPSDVKDDMAPDALDKIATEPTEVIVKRQVPYAALKVPQQYHLMGYRYHNVHEASRGYVAPQLSRQLRTGAEDEIISLPAPAPIASDSTPQYVDDGDMKVEDVVTPAPEVSLALSPPEALFKPIEYPALHIFNPAPGLQVFQLPLPYAETDPDFHLCPLPRYVTYDKETIHTATQKRYLDREDVIRGLMTWKKFPSQGLTSLSLTPTLTNVWVPRWTDAFGSDLMPEEVPPLFDGLPEEDMENISQGQDGDDEDEDANVEMTLTPEMVNAQFVLISTSTPTDEKPKEDMFPFGHRMPANNIPVSATGPVPREKREQELDFFLNKKYNRLGQKVQQKLDTLNNLKTIKDLVLK